MTILLFQQQQITAELIRAQHALGSSSPKGRKDPSMSKFPQKWFFSGEDKLICNTMLTLLAMPCRNDEASFQNETIHGIR